MKCPKCGYLGFETVDRCRNCGYDFSLSPTAEVVDLPLKLMPVEPDKRQSAGDLSFLDVAAAVEPGRRPAGGRPDGHRAMSADVGRARAQHVDELPLFGVMIPDDLPLITRPSPPRSPLAVRRATPEVPRLRSVSGHAATLDLDLEPAVSALPTRIPAQSTDAGAAQNDEEPEQDAPIAARLVAFVTDLLILAAIDAAVVYLTMQICGLGPEEFRVLPRAPLFAFLLIQNGGYLVAFTAVGQTLGKVAAGIRVVSAESSLASPDLGQAFMREVIWLALAVPAGLGLLTIFGRDHRGLHDRFARTRVVRD